MAYCDKLCRACLTSKESFIYFLCDNVSPDIYRFCTSIQIEATEMLPRALCDVCYDLLSKFNDFKKTCIESQNSLLAYKNLVKPENGTWNYTFQNNVEINIEIAESGIQNTELRDATKIEECGTVKKENESDDEVIDQCLDCHDSEQSELPKNVENKTFKSKKKHIKPINKKLITKKKHLKYSCEDCSKKFYYRSSYESHRETHKDSQDKQNNELETATKTIPCKQCNKTFATLSGMRRHHTNHHSRVNLHSLMCRTCGKIYNSRETLRTHQKTHRERKLYICDVCGKKCVSEYNLKIHLETHNKNRERSNICPHCRKTFFTRRMLVAHVSRRHSDRRYICQQCNYPFTDKTNLAKHLLIHEGKKPFKCDICEKSFANNSTLTDHRRLHTGERPYVCCFCPKSFVSKKRLVEHHRIHTGEKPYKCSDCNQCFSQRGSLKRHFKVHDKANIRCNN